MRCADLMKTDVECVFPHTSIRDTARKMRDQNIGFLPVCDESMCALGAVTDRDVAIRAVAEGLPLTSRVSTILTPEIIACDPNDDLEFARNLMMSRQKSRIMCLSRSGRLEGVISLSDLASLDEQGGAHVLREISARQHRCDSRWELPI
jgi:CBS domain-containing protein